MNEPLATSDGGVLTAGWQRRVVDRSLDDAKRRSIDRGARLIRAAARVLDRTDGESLTVQEVADEAGQSLRTLYQYFASKDDLLLAVFEEAMSTFARLIRAAIAGFDDPVERLAGAIMASARMPALHHHGIDRGLSRLRLQLRQAEPTLVASAQQPVTALFRELVGDVAKVAPQVDAEPAAYFILELRGSYGLSLTLGNDAGPRLPDVVDLSAFCLGGLGLPLPREWHDRIDKKLQLSASNSGSDGRTILRRLARPPGEAER